MVSGPAKVTSCKCAPFPLDERTTNVTATTNNAVRRTPARPMATTENGVRSPLSRRKVAAPTNGCDERLPLHELLPLRRTDAVATNRCGCDEQMRLRRTDAVATNRCGSDEQLPLRRTAAGRRTDAAATNRCGRGRTDAATNRCGCDERLRRDEQMRSRRTDAATTNRCGRDERCRCAASTTVHSFYNIALLSDTYQWVSMTASTSQQWALQARRCRRGSDLPFQRCARRREPDAAHLLTVVEQIVAGFGLVVFVDFVLGRFSWTTSSLGRFVVSRVLFVAVVFVPSPSSRRLRGVRLRRRSVFVVAVDLRRIRLRRFAFVFTADIQPAQSSLTAGVATGAGVVNRRRRQPAQASSPLALATGGGVAAAAGDGVGIVLHILAASRPPACSSLHRRRNHEAADTGEHAQRRDAGDHRPRPCRTTFVPIWPAPPERRRAVRSVLQLFGVSAGGVIRPARRAMPASGKPRLRAARRRQDARRALRRLLRAERIRRVRREHARELADDLDAGSRAPSRGSGTRCPAGRAAAGRAAAPAARCRP